MSRVTVADLMPGLIVPGEPRSAGGIIIPDGIRYEAPATRVFATPEAESAAELDLVRLVEQIERSGSRIPPDLRIDDRDLIEFPNFFEFCLSKRGMDQAPFARQLAVATYMLGEACPRCTNPAFWDIHKVPVDFPAEDFPSRVAFLEYGVCPRCHARRSELWASGELRVPVELDGCMGQRGGKSALLGLIGPYLIHKWVKMNKPVQTLGLMKNSILIGTFVGLTFAKAVELLWQPIHNAISDSPWFQELHALLDDHQERLGVELYKFKDTFINYTYKGIFLAPSGPNKRTLRGATRIMSFIDELGWFPHGDENDSKERASANEVYVSLDRSLKTVRKSAVNLLRAGYDNIPMAYMCCISSPSSYMDKIMSLIRAHEGSDDVVTVHLASWEMNPLYTRDDFSKEYRDDPIKAERDFGAQPPMSLNPWLSDMDVVSAMMSGRKNRISYQYEHIGSTSGGSYRYARLKTARPPEPCPGTILAMDAGYANNSLGISVIAPNADGDAKVLAVAEVAPVRGQNVLNYTYLTRDLLGPLITEFNVKLVVADRWQSIKLLQDLEDEHGIYTLQLSLNAAQSNYARDVMLDEEAQRIELPQLEISPDEIAQVDLEDYPHCFQYKPVAHLYHQFMTATLNPRGVADKGPGYTDDILRSLLVGLTVALDAEMVETYGILGSKAAPARAALGTKRASNIKSSNLGVRAGNGGLVSSGAASLGARSR